MHTRYSPVRRSPPWCCHHALPLDLHVLSLPLAFILSQDQTLRCLISFSSFSLLPQRGAPYPGRNPDFLDGGPRPLSIPVSSNAFPVALSQCALPPRTGTDCKLKPFSRNLQAPDRLFSTFFDAGAAFFRRTPAGGRPSAVCGCKGTNSSPCLPNFSSTFFGRIHDIRHNTLQNNSVGPQKNGTPN